MAYYVHTWEGDTLRWIKSVLIQTSKKLILSALVVSVIPLYLGICHVRQQSVPLGKAPFVHWSGLDPHNEVFITWESSSETDSFVRYGTDPDNLSLTLQDKASVTLHRLHLTGLMPDMRYYYQAGPSSVFPHDQLSKVQSFSTAPDIPKEFSVACVSDTQQIFGVGYYNRVAAAISKHSDAAFVIDAGDLSQVAEDQQHWNQFFKESVYMDRIPFVPCPGNHDDIDSPDSKYVKYFGITANDRDVYYAFDWGNARFIIAQIANTYHADMENPRNEIPFKWLEETLAASQDRDYRILVYHRDNIKGMNALVEKYNVSLVLHGHIHSYRRYMIDGHTYLEIGNGATMQDSPVIKAPNDQKRSNGAGFTQLTINQTGIRLESFTPTMDRMDDVFLRRDIATGNLVPEETTND